MLFLTSGNISDRKKYINTLITEYGGDPSSVHRISKDDLSEEKTINNLVVTQGGLFGDIEFFVLTDLARELPLASLLEDYTSSSNVIIFSEASVTKKITEKFAKMEVDHKEFTKELKKEVSRFNIFSLADSLGRRDKKNLWLEYHQALSNASVEEINGIFLWQIKNMILVSTGATTSMKSFVLQKNQGFVKNYSLVELKELMRLLTVSFHNRDIYDTLENKVEKMILSL